MSPLADRILALLGESVSPINAHAIFRRALAVSGLDASTLDFTHLPRLLPALETSLALFVVTPGIARSVISRLEPAALPTSSRPTASSRQGFAQRPKSGDGGFDRCEILAENWLWNAGLRRRVESVCVRCAYVALTGLNAIHAAGRGTLIRFRRPAYSGLVGYTIPMRSGRLAGR